MRSSVAERDVERELDRYLILCSELGPGLSMFSERIDEAWHERLDETDAYEASCRALGIAPIGHLPAEEAEAPATHEWVSTYEERWGLLPEAWFANAVGIVDGEARDLYLSSRTITSAGCCQDTEKLPVGCCQDTEWAPLGCCQDTE